MVPPAGSHIVVEQQGNLLLSRAARLRVCEFSEVYDWHIVRVDHTLHSRLVGPVCVDGHDKRELPNGWLVNVDLLFWRIAELECAHR